MNQVIQKDTVFYILGLSMACIFKFWFTSASLDELSFLLSPVSKFISFLTGQEASYEAGQGYYYQLFNIVINKSCSGFNFFTLCSVMLIFLSVGYFKEWKYKAIAFVLSILLALVSTIVVNTFRIYVSIILMDFHIAEIDGTYLHQGIGVTFFLFSLLILYSIVKKLLENTAKLISK